MRFTPTPLAGAFVIELEPRADERGMFARAFCAREFAEQGLEASVAQANISSNRRAGTVRGMHLQRGDDAEVKLVRCVNGEIYDVIVDMREGSETYLRWFGVELSQDNGRMMYVPKGFAHGYQALTDGATVFYMVSAFYAPDKEGGIHHADPAIGIEWPLAVAAVSMKDANLPSLAIGPRAET